MMSVSLLLNPCARTPVNEKPPLSPSPNHRRRSGSLPHLGRRFPVVPVLLSLQRRRFVHRCSSDEAAGEPRRLDDPDEAKSKNGFWKKWKFDSGEMRSRMAKLGLAAVLAYGLFDGVTYTTFFVLAFLGYEKSTGKNPAANLQALLGIIVLMWTGNNITRPFRVAGAAALAPFIDKGMKKIQKYFKLPNQVFAFALVVSVVVALCLMVVGLLILSRWGK